MIASAQDPDRLPDNVRQSDGPPTPRLFLREPGWRVALKVGSEKEFCYMTAPGQDYYHRLLDGEIYIQHGDEKLCLPCADRRGLLADEPRRLSPPVTVIQVEGEPYEVR